MVKQGWMPIYRKLQENHLWEDKPFAKGQAWIDLLLLANHTDNKFVLGNELMTVEAGSFVTSVEKLKHRWGWSNTKVINFLKLLENDGMIVKKSDTKKTVITIVNYGDYAVYEKTKTMPKRYENDTETIRKHTNNNENNYNNENNEKKKRKKEASYDEILSSVADDGLRDLYVEYIKMRKMIKSPMTDRALTMLIKKVNELEPTSIDRQKQLIETAIMNNWKSVYPLKENKSNSINEAINKRNAVDREVVEKLMNSIDNPAPTAANDESIRARAEALQKELAEKY